METVLKIIFGLFCLGGCIYQLIDFLNLYYKYETTVQIFTEYPKNISFPAMTICANNRVHKQEFCKIPDQRFHCENIGTINLAVLRFVQQKPVKDILRLSHQFRYGLFYLCTVDPFREEETCRHVKSFSGVYTACRTYNYRKLQYEKYNRTKSLKIAMSFYPDTHIEPYENIGAKVSIHNNLFIPDVIENFQEIFPDESVYVYLKKVTTILLPSPYRTNCTDYYDEWKKNHTKPNSRENCVQHCIEKKHLKECGCIIYLLVIPEWNFNKKCVYNNTAFKQGINSGCEHRYIDGSNWIDPCKRSCPPNCRQDTFETKFIKKRFRRSSHYKNDFPEEKLKSDVTLKYKDNEHVTYEHKPKIDDVEVLSYVGGYLGVWLGASLFSTFLQLKGILNSGMDRYKSRKTKEEKSPFFQRRSRKTLDNI